MFRDYFGRAVRSAQLKLLRALVICNAYLAQTSFVYDDHQMTIKSVSNDHTGWLATIVSKFKVSKNTNV